MNERINEWMKQTNKQTNKKEPGMNSWIMKECQRENKYKWWNEKESVSQVSNIGQNQILKNFF